MDYQPISGRVMPRFAGIKTFFRLPHVAINADYDLAITGVPFDGGLSYRPGARFAPSKLREISSLGRVFHMERKFDFTQKLKVADIGDCPIVPIDLKKSYEIIENYFKDILNMNKKFISIGGDHSTTLPILRALHKRYNKKISLIHFDAHLDTYPAAWGCEYHHGSFLRHAIDEGLVDGSQTYQFGIRGPLTGSSDLDFIKKNGVSVHTVDDIRRAGIFEFIKQLPILSENPTYISFDIDCLDPAYAPATGTPVVGGLTSYETQQILRSLNIPKLVGADIVEVSPVYDHADITSLAALDTLFELINLFAKK